MFLRWLAVAILGSAILHILDNPNVHGWTARGVGILGFLVYVFGLGLMLHDELEAGERRAYAERSRAFEGLRPVQPQAVERFMAETAALNWTIISLPAGVVQAIAAAVIRDGLPFTMRGMPLTRAEFVQAREVFLARGYLRIVKRKHCFNREGRIFLLKVYTGQVVPSPSEPPKVDALRLVTRALPTQDPQRARWGSGEIAVASFLAPLKTPEANE
jgi:hypothetical protein